MAIDTLFSNYISAFLKQDISAILSLYSMPCLLATPDEVKWLTTDEAFKSAFQPIFVQLEQASVKDIVAPRASYTHISATLINACVDWQFIDENQQVFTQFCAFYAIHMINHKWQIVNVISYDISQYQALEHSLKIL